MVKFLSNPESKLYQFLEKIMDFFLLNTLCILGSIPILTISCSIIACYSVVQKRVTASSTSLTKDFFRAYKSNFRRGISIQLVLMGLSSILLLSFLSLKQLTGIVQYLSMIGLIIGTVVLVIEWLFILPYSARYENSLFASFKVCLQVASLNTKLTLELLFACCATYFLITSNDLIFSVASLLFLFFGFSSIVYWVNKKVIPTLSQYER